MRAVGSTARIARQIVSCLDRTLQLVWSRVSTMLAPPDARTLRRLRRDRIRELSFATTNPPSPPAGHSAGANLAHSSDTSSFVPLYTIQRNRSVLNTIQLVHTPVPPHARVPLVDTSLDSPRYSTVPPTYARTLSSTNIEMINVYLSTNLGPQSERARVVPNSRRCRDNLLSSNTEHFRHRPIRSSMLHR